MKKFEENGFTATVTDKVVRWEIPISSLIEAFNNSPEIKVMMENIILM